MSDLPEEDLVGLMDYVLGVLADGLRDQAAVAAEEGNDDLAEVLREIAERVRPLP